MGTRLGFRPRPVDIQKQLSIVRDVSELDSTDGLCLKEGPAEEQPEEPAVPAPKPRPKKNIPVPDVRPVPSYRHDYLPVFQQNHTYTRGQGGIGWFNPEYVEYDLDSEDERWLAKWNSDGQVRLTDEKLERIFWKLELSCAEATDRALAAAGAAPAERTTSAALAPTDHLAYEAAIEMLKRDVGGRDTLLEAAYQYWREKRKQLGKPLMRRLQAPTSASDTNPFNVFRPREKVNRPQTRRRRENNDECLEKLKMIRSNIESAKEMVDWLAKRELKKRDLVLVECSMNNLQCRLHHHPRSMHEQLEQEVWTSLRQQRKQQPVDRRKDVIEANRWGNKRFKADSIPLGMPDPAALAELPPPPSRQMPLDMLFAATVDMTKMKLGEGTWKLPSDLDVTTCRVRVGRGGRCIVDRCNALTLKPFTHVELQENLLHVDPVPPIASLRVPGAGQKRALQPSEGANGSLGRDGVTAARAGSGHISDSERKAIRPASQVANKSNLQKAVPKGTPPVVGQPIKRGPGRPPKTKNIPPPLANGDSHGLQGMDL